jgi:hypothetical protein
MDDNIRLEYNSFGVFMIDPSTLESEVLGLPPTQRAMLAQRLLQSLEGLSQEEIEELWLAEARRRDAEFDSGEELGRPADEVFRDLRSRLK